MNGFQRDRCHRLLGDLLWLVAEQDEIEVEGQMRDNIAEIRDLLWEAVER